MRGLAVEKIRDGFLGFAISVITSYSIHYTKLYEKSALPRPIKELKGFSKVKLAPGEEKMVSFTIDKTDLSYFDDTQNRWVAEPGVFEAFVGASSADIRSTVSFELK